MLSDSAVQLGRPFLSQGIEFVACLLVEPMRLWRPHTVSEKSCNSDLSPRRAAFRHHVPKCEDDSCFFFFSFLSWRASQCAITPCGPYGVLNGFCGAKRCSSLVWPADQFLFTNVKGAFLFCCTTAWGGGDLSFFFFFKTIIPSKRCNSEKEAQNVLTDPVWYHFIAIWESGSGSCPTTQDLSRFPGCFFFCFVFLYKTSVDDLALYVN